ncbi:MAG: helix-turn-helix domain-containing protein [Bryobacteraceae bacterium]
MIELPLRDMIDVFTAARAVGVSPETIRRWCDQGRIPCVKLVGRWRIFRSEFVTWISTSTILPLVPLEDPSKKTSTKPTKPTKQLDLFNAEA